AFADVGTATNSKPFSGLVNGVTYYATVRATNGAGLTVTATSDGVVIDNTAPTTGTVTTPNIQQLRNSYQTETDRITAIWSGFVDSQSGIARYEMAISESPTPPFSGPLWTNVGLVTTYTQTGLTLVPKSNGGGYFVFVRACDYAGNCSAAAAVEIAID